MMVRRLIVTVVAVATLIVTGLATVEPNGDYRIGAS
jgi:hypothetical protein